jgi:hypothetical protein
LLFLRPHAIFLIAFSTGAFSVTLAAKSKPVMLRTSGGGQREKA